LAHSAAAFRDFWLSEQAHCYRSSRFLDTLETTPKAAFNQTGSARQLVAGSVS